MTEPTHDGGAGGRWRIAMWGAAAALLALPLGAMRVTGEVRWGGADFLMFGAMLLLAGGAVELAVRRSRDRAFLLGAAVAVGTAFLLVWVNLAVGFIGAEGDPANLPFAGVLAVAALGALLSRGRARGLARAAAAAGCLQAAACAGAFAAGLPVPIAPSVAFTGLWLLSAAAFARAARRA